MKHGIFSFLGTACARLLWATGIAVTSVCAAQAAELRVLTHSAFAVPEPLLKQFEKESGVTLRISKAGDAGEMLNKLILTRAHPIADVVFGLDNALIPKAHAAGVLAAYNGPAATRNTVATLPYGVVPVDYGFVTVNYDKAWFATHKLALPKTLEDLAQPAYAKLLAVQNPATSSTGNAFMLATIATLGEAPAFDWWARMRANGVKVAKGWSEVYYTEFTRNGGKYPLVISYHSSPAAELFYSKDPLPEPPTGSLSLVGGVFRQVEGVALVKGGKQAVAAAKFVEFMRSTAVQTAMQTEMWMLPVDATVPHADVLKQWAPVPTAFSSPSDDAIAKQSAAWIKRWVKVVLK